MSASRLLRLSGLAALVGGSLLAFTTVVQFLNHVSPDLLDPASSSGGEVILFVRTSLQPLGEVLVALGLIGLYARQARATGIPGLIGFVLAFLVAFLGTVLMQPAGLAALLVYLGWALFGVSSLRARVYPRVASVLLIVGGLVGQLFNPSVFLNPSVVLGPGATLGEVGALGALVLTVGVAWLGFSLFTERVEEEAQPVAQTSPNLLRLAGLAAVVGGVLVVLMSLVQLFKLFFPLHGSIPYETSDITLAVQYGQQNLTYAGSALVALGLVGFYVRQLEDNARSRLTEILMLLGFVLAFVGTLWTLQLENTFLAVLVQYLGWILFGVLSLRIGVYPRLALIIIILSGIVASVTSPAGVTTLLDFLGDVFGEDDLSPASSYLWVGQYPSPIVYLGVIAEILFYAAVVWLGFFLRLEQRGARAERQQPERAGATRAAGGLWWAVLVVGLVPLALLLIPGVRQDAGLAASTARASEDTNPACPPADQSLDQAVDGVWGGANRLIAHDACRHLVATVRAVEGPNPDGDMDIWLTPDREYNDLIGTPNNLENARRWETGGNFEIEFIPRDGRTTDPDTGEAGPPHLPLPSEGDKVDVWGAYVFDSTHNYYELHPVFSVYISSDGGNTWDGPYTSGPQYGGSPASSTDDTQWTTCRDENGNPCLGYDGDETN
jgi:hypothetical protein